MQVFISYRRGASNDVVGRISDRLRAEFGSEAVFFDVADIAVGVEFTDRLRKAIEGADVFLAIVGPDWAERGDFSERDFVRIEVAHALEKNVRVIPVLVGGARVPDNDGLPEPIRRLTRLQAEQVRSLADFDGDMARLIAAIEAQAQFDADLDQQQRVVVGMARRAEEFEALEVGLSAEHSAGQLVLLLSLQRMLAPLLPLFHAQLELARKVLDGVEHPGGGLDDAIRAASDRIPADRNWLRRRLRAQTDILRGINGALLRLVGRNPELAKLVPSLPELHDHLLEWVAKYECLRTDEHMCLIFVGVKQRKPFPSDIDAEIDRALADLGRRHRIEL